MSTKKYSHVIVIGIDGAGSFVKEADTPHFDRIFGNGAVTYHALASNPSISAECWGSILIGVGPEVHGLTNQIVGKTPTPDDRPFPTVFRRIREAMPDAVLGSYCDWNSISFGIVEHNIDVSFETARDTELTPIVCDYIKANRPTFLFVHMDSVDGAGHKNGYGTPAHLNRIHEVDELVNDIYCAAKDAGILDDTLFMLVSDHGGRDFSHGGWSDQEKYVTFAAIGHDVQKTTIEDMNIRDVAALILYAFGIDAPAFDEKGWTAQIPPHIWNDPAITEYRDISHLTGAAPRISKAPHTSELI